jgi:hypothetical protein
MKRLHMIVAALLTGMVLGSSSCGQKSYSAQEDGAGKSQALFNGKDLAGWQVHGTEKWYVEGGELICESGPDKQYGYLSTDKTYKDFEISVDFKQEADGNSGLFFRSALEGTKISGWQVEIAPKGMDTGGIYESYGRGWLVQIPEEKENILKQGEWNKMKVRVVGDQVTTWLNDQQMVDLKDEKIGQGHGAIALQIHSGGALRCGGKISRCGR